MFSEFLFVLIHHHNLNIDENNCNNHLSNNNAVWEVLVLFHCNTVYMPLTCMFTDLETNICYPVTTQVVEDGYEFFAKRQLVTLFSAPNYCGEFDNAGGMMSVDESLMCSFQVQSSVFLRPEFRACFMCWRCTNNHCAFQILKPSEKKAKYQYGGVNSGRPVTPPRTAQAPKKRWAAGGEPPALPRMVSGAHTLPRLPQTLQPSLSQLAHA